MRIRNLAIASIAVVALLAGACKSSGTESSNGSQPMSTELGTGVTADTIKIGFAYIDVTALKDIMPTLNQGNYETAFQAYVDGVNDAGGINGRKVEVVYAPINPVKSDSPLAACTKLTEDEKVFAVVAPNAYPAALQCILKDHATPVVGSDQTAALLAAAKAPWFTPKLSTPGATTKVLDGAIKDGSLKGKKVAIIAGDADKGVSEAASAQLKAGGITVVDSALQSPDLGDISAAVAESKVFAQRFQSDGADAVLVIGNAFTIFAQALSQTTYRPQLVGTTTGLAETYLLQSGDTAILNGMIAGGGPSMITEWTTPQVQKCVTQVMKVDPTRQITPPDDPSLKTPDTFTSITNTCQFFELFAAIAQKAGKTLNNDTFRMAGQNLGKITLPAVGGESDFTPDVPNGNPPLFLSSWDSATNKFNISKTPVK